MYKKMSATVFMVTVVAATATFAMPNSSSMSVSLLNPQAPAQKQSFLSRLFGRKPPAVRPTVPQEVFRAQAIPAPVPPKRKSFFSRLFGRKSPAPQCTESSANHFQCKEPSSNDVDVLSLYHRSFQSKVQIQNQSEVEMPEILLIPSESVAYDHKNAKLKASHEKDQTILARDKAASLCGGLNRLVSYTVGDSFHSDFLDVKPDQSIGEVTSNTEYPWVNLHKFPHTKLRKMALASLIFWVPSAIQAAWAMTSIAAGIATGGLGFAALGLLPFIPLLNVAATAAYDYFNVGKEISFKDRNNRSTYTDLIARTTAEADSVVRVTRSASASEILSPAPNKVLKELKCTAGRENIRFNLPSYVNSATGIREVPVEALSEAVGRPRITRSRSASI